MLKQESVQPPLISSQTSTSTGDVRVDEQADECAYHSDSGLNELALVRYEISELKRESRETRYKLEEALRLAKRRHPTSAVAQRTWGARSPARSSA